MDAANGAMSASPRLAAAIEPKKTQIMTLPMAIDSCVHYGLRRPYLAF
jgi:hypothetical protein